MRVEQAIAGNLGAIDYRYRLYKSDITGADIQEFEGVTGESASLSNYRDCAWELALPMEASEQIEPQNDYVRLYVEVRDEVGEWRSYPMGLYRFDEFSAAHSPAFSGWSLSGVSLEIMLLRDMAYQGYVVAAGTGVLAAARQILLDKGIPATKIHLPLSENVTLVSPMYFDPYQDASTCYWLRIVNALLAAGGFYAVLTDAEGNFVTKKIDESGAASADVTYTSRGEDAERMIVENIADEHDMTRLANRVVVIAGDPNTSPPVVGVAENHDPDSPFSIEALGYVKQDDPITLQNAVSQAEANRIARRELARSSGYSRKLTIKTLPDPRRGLHETYALDIANAYGTIAEGNWRVVGWTLPLNLGSMTHEVQQLVRLT